MAGGLEQNAIIVVQAGGEDNGVDYGLAETCPCQAVIFTPPAWRDRVRFGVVQLI